MGLLSEITSQQVFTCETLALIDAYEKEQPFDAMIPTARAVVHFFMGNYKEAESCIKQAIQKLPANYVNHHYYALIAQAQGDPVLAGKECALTVKLAAQYAKPEGWDILQKQLEDLLQDCVSKLSPDETKDVADFQNTLDSQSNYFPSYHFVSQDIWEPFLGRFLYMDKSKRYNDYVGLFPQSHFDVVTVMNTILLRQSKQKDTYALIPIEDWKARKVASLRLAEPCIIALTTTEVDQTVTFADRHSKRYQTLYKAPNVYHCLRGEKGLTISSDKPFITSRPLPLGHSPKRKKLVLNIFEDSLSQFFLNQTHYENMPHTKKFFDKGTIFTNCYASSEWTRPSYAGLFTGLYTTHHHLKYHFSSYRLPTTTETVSEIMSKNGYFTANFTGSVGLSPYIGGFRGFDRTVYKSVAGYSDTELITNALDHIDAFKEMDQYVMLALFDIHISDENCYNNSISCPTSYQTSIDFRTQISQIEGTEKSVKRRYHEPSIVKYRRSLELVDKRLKMIYDYLTEHYSEDEYIVCFYSDHGTSFIYDNDYFLKHCLTNSSLMIRGSGAPVGETDEYINHFDYIPAMTTLAGIAYDFSRHDCVRPRIFGGDGRDYAYTECIFNGQKYMAVIRSDAFECRFETVGTTFSDGTFDMSQGFKLEVFEARTEKKINNQELHEEFEAIVFDHIKENIRY